VRKRRWEVRDGVRRMRGWLKGGGELEASPSREGIPTEEVFCRSPCLPMEDEDAAATV